MNSQPYSIILGCVADDFTGASDVASFLAEGGASCLLINGVPGDDFVLDPGYDAVVIALKTRNVEPQSAVADTTKSFEWLRRKGAKKLYFKYCSTFDSTPKGNIGPVLDALLEQFKIPYTILCPALPVNRRIVKEGILYVDGMPLDKSPMRNHPINPMWDSSIVRLMEAQSKYPCFTLDYRQLYQDKDTIMEYMKELELHNNHFYLVGDYFEEKHGARQAELFKDLPLLSGGSALPKHLFRHYAKSNQIYGNKLLNNKQKDKSFQSGLILSGSCSVATCNQIRNFINLGGTALEIKAECLMDGSQTVEDIWKFIEQNRTKDVLIYSFNKDKGNIAPEKQIQISGKLEGTVAKLGRMAVESGINNIVVAGGETSGAVIQALGSAAFEIGKSLAPGVPILYPRGYPDLKITLKSGNFGQPDFFSRALSIMKGVDDQDEYSG